jgi:quercetin dioxygenase-like cupin family protein
MRHHEPSDEIRSTAALYSLGALSEEEARNFEQHVAEGCEVCARERRDFGETAAKLPCGLAEQQPSPGLRKQLLERAGAPRAGAHIVRTGDGKWTATPFAGVTVKTLHFDRTTGMMTNLVRMAPRSSYPPHRHTAVEECLVLEGDIRQDEMVLGPGDYSRLEANTDHGMIETEGGCLLLIISSARDELLA